MTLLLELDPFSDISLYFWLATFLVALVGYIVHEVRLRRGQPWPIAFRPTLTR